MKLTLINPPWYGIEKNSIQSYHLGIGYLTSYLKSKGHEIVFIDALFGKHSDKAEKIQLKYQTVYRIGKPFDEIVKEIPSDSDYIGIHAPFNNHATIIEALSKVSKQKFPTIPIIVGGPYPSACPEMALSEAVDYVIIGEGEIPLERLLSNERPKNIKGFVFRENNKIVNNGMAELIQELDTVPFPDKEILHYKELFGSRDKSRIRKGVEILEFEDRGYPVITSRGCPYDCNFCSIHHVNGYAWRYRSAANVIKEIEELIEDYKLDSISFRDDMFTADKKRFHVILDGLIILQKKLKKKITWSCPNGIRVDHLDENTLKKIKESGCNSLTLGVQNGDQKMLNLMNTKLDLSKVEETVRLCKKYNIPTAGFFIFGYPGEDRKSFFKTLKYAKKLFRAGMSEFRINLARAYLNTKMYKMCKEMDYFIIKDVENLLVFPGDKSEANLKTPEFNPKELIWRRDFARRHLMSYENFIYWKTVYLLEKIGLKLVLKRIIPINYWNPAKKLMFNLSKRIGI